MVKSGFQRFPDAVFRHSGGKPVDDAEERFVTQRLESFFFRWDVLGKISHLISQNDPDESLFAHISEVLFPSFGPFFVQFPEHDETGTQREECQEFCDGLGRLPMDFLTAGEAVRRSDLRVKEPQIIVGLRSRSDGRTAGSRRNVS